MRSSAYFDAFYKAHTHRRNVHHELIWKALCRNGLKGNVVDLGCGPALVYVGKSVALTGIDWSLEALCEARRNIPEGIFVCADATSTGLPQGQYDTVVMLGLLDYFPDWAPLLTEARRLAKPEGVLLATVLDGFEGKMWKKLLSENTEVLYYERITPNWYLCVFNRGVN